MKNTIIFAILLGVAAASPTPLPYDEDPQGMKWTGEVFPGQNYTLYGDIDSINDQILAINPDYKPEPEARSFTKRHTGDITCGNFATADAHDTQDALFALSDKSGTCHAKANSCIRISCRNTSGVWLCNNQNKEISPKCSYLGSSVSHIYAACGEDVQYKYSLSGQQFDTDDYNVVVGYANCKDSVSKKPSSYTKWGPNGKPIKSCEKCSIPDPN